MLRVASANSSKLSGFESLQVFIVALKIPFTGIQKQAEIVLVLVTELLV